MSACFSWACKLANVRAAPHLPFGILSPYRDGERGAVTADFANHQRPKRRRRGRGRCPADRWVTD
ncbi:MAG: hypothetical protein E5W90_26865 [Mesorhizobium sp.]|nr:MAG: hypothetical protein E5W90_26865 [Mesorhizobium sp.]